MSDSEQMNLFHDEYDAGIGKCVNKNFAGAPQDAKWDTPPFTAAIKARKVVKVLFGIPNEGHTECESYDNRLEMAFHLGSLQVLSTTTRTEYCGAKFDIPDNTEYQFSLSTVGKIFPALARERIGEIAMDNGFDYLFMVDDDMITPVDLFERLVKHNVDIVAALAFTRYPPHSPVIYNLEKGYDGIRKERYYINNHVKRYPKDTLVQCDAVGFGAVLIKVDVLRAMAKPIFMSTSGAGEDIHFCHKARECGFKVHMDTATKLGHLGQPKLVTEEVYEAESDVKEERSKYGDDKFQD